MWCMMKFYHFIWPKPVIFSLNSCIIYKISSSQHKRSVRCCNKTAVQIVEIFLSNKIHSMFCNVFCAFSNNSSSTHNHLQLSSEKSMITQKMSHHLQTVQIKPNVRHYIPFGTKVCIFIFHDVTFHLQELLALSNDIKNIL